MQERIASGLEESFIVHSNASEEYIVNLHALHNAHLIHRHFPRHLTAPRPIYTSEEVRRAHHDELAGRLRKIPDVRTEVQADNRSNKRAREEEDRTVDN